MLIRNFFQNLIIRKQESTIKLKTKLILRGVAQLVRHWVCFLEIISSNPTNLRATGGLYGR